MIIDTHVHLSSYQHKEKSLKDILDLLLSQMENQKIDYAIIIPDNIENDPNIADLSTALSLIKETNNLFLLGSPQIIQRGNKELNKYKQLLENDVIKGLKFFPGHDPYYPTDERCLPYYEISQELDTPVVFHTGENSGNQEVSRYNDPKYIVEIANKYPDLKVIITHYFWPKIEYCYQITKNSPNIYFETAGLADGEVIEKSGGLEKIKSILSKTIKEKPEKVIFGTDWPMCSVQDHINLIKSLNLSSEIQDMVFSKNAKKVYRLPM